MLQTHTLTCISLHHTRYYCTCGQASFLGQTGTDVAKAIGPHEVLSTHQRQMLRHSNRDSEVSVGFGVPPASIKVTDLVLMTLTKASLCLCKLAVGSVPL